MFEKDLDTAFNESQYSYNDGKESVYDTVKNVKHVGAFLNSLLIFLSNPVNILFAIIIGFALYFFSITSVVGNSNACQSSTISGVSSSYSTDKTERIKQFASFLLNTKWNFLNGKQMTRQQVAAIIGNSEIESGVDTFKLEAIFNSKDKEKYRTNDSIHDWAKQRQSGQFCNSTVYKVGNVKVTSCNGLGLFQWTHYPGRTKALLDFASSKNVAWWTPEVQFEFFQKELEEHYGKRLVSNGFNSSNNVDDLTKSFLKTYLGVNIKLKERQKAANRIMGEIDNISGQSYSSSTCSQSFSGNGQVADFAVKAAHKPGDRNVCRDTSYKPLMEAASIAFKNTGSGLNGVGTLCDCGKFVSVVVRGSGFDPKFPGAGTLVQEPYMLKNPDKYKQYSNFDERQPGDIYITNNGSHPADGHIEMYVGKVEGKEMIAVASWNQYDAKLVPLEKTKRKSNSSKGCAVDVYGGRVYKCFHLVK